MNTNTAQSLHCRSCEAWSTCAFKALTPSELDTLFQSKASRVYQKHEKIFLANTKPLGVYCIKKGLVKLTTQQPNNNSHSEILYLAQAGELLGVGPVVREELYHYNAETVEESEICQIDKELFVSYLKNNQKFSYEVLLRSSERVKILDLTIARLAHMSVRERIAETLLFLEQRYGKTTTAGANLNLGLTREEIAQLSGTVQESVVRVLNDFKKEGLIELNKREIVIKNEKGLHQIYQPHYQA